MELFRRADLARLLPQQTPPCISVFMSTERHYPETDQNPIRYKNLLKQVEARLGDLTGSTPLQDLVDSLSGVSRPELWRAPSHGLAVFATATSCVHYRLPIRVPELVVVADSFHIKPLLKLLSLNQRFLVLALSLNEVRLFEGTLLGLSPIHPGTVPASAREVVGEEKAKAFSNIHATGGAGSGAIHHGHGAEGYRDQEIIRFVRALDDALCTELRDDPVPLIVAADVALAATFRNLSRYPHLADDAADGNFETSSPEEILERVRPAAGEHFSRSIAAVLTSFENGRSRHTSVSELSTIARCMVEGRVRTLLLTDGEHLWGNVDPQSGEVSLHDGKGGPGYDDVLDDLAQGVLARGGDVLIVDKKQMPDGGPAAAVLRW